jgi:hypothetical protein
VRITSASTPEWASYPHLLDAVITATATTPRAVVADRGYSVSSVFELHTSRLTRRSEVGKMRAQPPVRALPLRR